MAKDTDNEDRKTELELSWSYLSQKPINSSFWKARGLILVYYASAWQALRQHYTDEDPGDRAGEWHLNSQDLILFWEQHLL